MRVSYPTLRGIVGGVNTVVLGVLGAFFAWAGIMYIRKQRHMARVPLHTVASAPNSQSVKIIGIASPMMHLQPLIAPFSQTPCLAYELEARYAEHGKNVIERRRQVMPFLLIDDTGTAMLDVSSQLPFLSGCRPTLDQGFFSLGATSDRYPAVRMFGRERIDQIVERVLLPNDRVMVYGCAMRQPVPAAGDYRTGSREQVSIVKPAPGELWLVQVEAPRS